MKLTFFGQSAWGFEVADDHRILIDPYPIKPEAKALIDAYANESLSHVLVTHAGFDHLGITLDLLQRRPDARLVADIAVVRHAQESGLHNDRIDVIGWNMEIAAGKWRIRALEAKHASAIESAGGEYITGMPLGFMIRHEVEKEVRVFHLGDTSIFSDLAMFGQLYRPMVAIVPVCGAMNAREAALATLWTGADIAIPAHFTTDPGAAVDFCNAVSYLPREIQTWVPELGRTYTIERETKISS